MSEPFLNDWEAIVAALPPNWEELADEHKQLQTQYGNAKITNAGDLLRLILVHVAAGLPLRQTVALVAESGGPDISPMRLHKKMIRATGYLQALVAGLVEMPFDVSREKWAGYDISLVDATGISRPGSVNGDARIHTRIRLDNLAYVEAHATGLEYGETFCRFTPACGELIIGDRGYCQARGIAYVVDAGADVLVRFNRTSMPLLLADGKTQLEVLPLLRSLSSARVHERFVHAQHKEDGKIRLIQGRLCVMRLPHAEAEKARKRAREEQGASVSDDTLEAAAYVILFTTVPLQRLAAAQCIELYRLRWQIELLFKRWKSICGIDKMPNYRPDTILSWLYAKLLAALLLERLASKKAERPPSSTDEKPKNVLARQPWKLTLLLWPLFLAALLPTTLTSALISISAIATRLDGLDHTTRARQVATFRGQAHEDKIKFQEY